MQSHGEGVGHGGAEAGGAAVAGGVGAEAGGVLETEGGERGVNVAGGSGGTVGGITREPQSAQSVPSAQIGCDEDGDGLGDVGTIDDDGDGGDGDGGDDDGGDGDGGGGGGDELPPHEPAIDEPIGQSFQTQQSQSLQ